MGPAVKVDGFFGLHGAKWEVAGHKNRSCLELFFEFGQKIVHDGRGKPRVDVRCVRQVFGEKVAFDDFDFV